MSLVVDFSQVHNELANYLARLADPVPYFDFVGEKIKHDVQERIQYTKEDPDGHEWEPWRPYTAERREFLGNYDQGIMWDTGVLLESVYFDVDGAFGLDIGTNVWYAANQQEGKGRLPKREIFGWEKDQLPMLAQAFATFVETGAI